MARPETLLAEYRVPVYKTITVIFKRPHVQHGPVLLATGITEIRCFCGIIEAWDRYGHVYQWYTCHVRSFSVR